MSGVDLGQSCARFSAERQKTDARRYRLAGGLTDGLGSGWCVSVPRHRTMGISRNGVNAFLQKPVSASNANRIARFRLKGLVRCVRLRPMQQHSQSCGCVWGTESHTMGLKRSQVVFG